MQNNLLPPFVMRAAGAEVHDTAKIQVDTPTERDHSIYFPETQLRIPLSLWGMFSYFPTSKPTSVQMMEIKYISVNTRTLEPALRFIRD